MVLMANVPHDHGGRGSSCCVAILWTGLYVGRIGGESPHEVGFSLGAMQLRLKGCPGIGRGG